MKLISYDQIQSGRVSKLIKKTNENIIIGRGKMLTQEECKDALDCMNSGQWLQLEGSVGRRVKEFIDAGVLVKDEEKTKKDGPVRFVDGYGRPIEQFWAKIDWDKVQEINEEI
jgi:hypothetical protein